jgi:hypothetical protein
MKDLRPTQSVTQERDSISSIAFSAVELHANWHPLPHGQIEPDVVFYIGLGDRFDDDRRRIRSA